MRTTGWCGHVLATLCCGFALLGGAAQAEDFDTVGRSAQSLDERVSELEAELVSLRREHGAGFQGYSAPYSGCGDCGCCCTPCCWNGPGLPCGWYVGGEFIYMEPRWKGFDAFTLSAFSPLGGGSTTTTVGHEYDYDEAFRFWAGYTGCSGLGVRASWWELDHDSEPVVVTVGVTAPSVNIAFATGSLLAVGEGETFLASQSLELQTFDLEVTNCYDACGGSIIVAFGLRYVEFDVQTRERRVDAAGTLLTFGDFSESFEGLGPTLALDFVRPLCCSRWSLYANLRGTIAFGEEEQAARRESLLTGQVDVGSRSADEPLAIAELQIALQWCCGNWFARGGYQAQYWDDVASDQTALGFGGDLITSNTRSDLGLQGFFIAAGAQF